jgi:hypothetical protein
VIDSGTYDLNGMRVEVNNHRTATKDVVIDVNPTLVLWCKPYGYKRMEIWAVCWESAWTGLKLFHEANSLGQPERAKLVRQ